MRALAFPAYGSQHYFAATHTPPPAIGLRYLLYLGSPRHGALHLYTFVRSGRQA